MIDRLALVIPGNPPRKNQRHRIVRMQNGGNRLVNTEEYADFVSRLGYEWLIARKPVIKSGAWSLIVNAYWDRQRRNLTKLIPLGVDVPLGDWDAPVSAIGDALEEIGALDDDVRICTALVSKHYDKQNPRLEIELTRL